MNAKITWDLVMSEDMSFAEGCYQIENSSWQVVMAFKEDNISKIDVRNGMTWDSGVTGMNIIFPQAVKINASTLLKVMSDILGVVDWEEVRGPDSIVLR